MFAEDAFIIFKHSTHVNSTPMQQLQMPHSMTSQHSAMPVALADHAVAQPNQIEHSNQRTIQAAFSCATYLSCVLQSSGVESLVKLLLHDVSFARAVQQKDGEAAAAAAVGVVKVRLLMSRDIGGPPCCSAAVLLVAPTVPVP